jgi:hypothetical protein
MRDFDDQLQHVDKLWALGRPWGDIRMALDGLQRLAQNDENKMQIAQQKHKSIVETARRQFEDEYQRLQDDIEAGNILDNHRLGECEAVLWHLAKFDEPLLNLRIQEIRNYWARWRKLNELEKKVEKYIVAYRESVARGFDLAEARKDHLDLAEQVIQAAAAELGDDPRFMRLLGKIKQAIRDADLSPLATDAVMGNFQKIVEQLSSKNSDYEETLIDMYGKQQGVRRRDDAIDWYMERAREFALRKADEYLRAAKDLMGRQNPYIANKTIIDAEGLWQLLPDKRDELGAYRKEFIEPMLGRMNRARELLVGIPHANLDTALADFEEARRIWPMFDQLIATTAEEGVPNIVQVAREWILQAINNDFQTMLQLESLFGHGHQLLFRINESKIKQLATYLDFNGGHYKSQYGTFYQSLYDQYYKQFTRHEGLLQAAENARHASRQNDFKGAYDALAPYADLLSTEPDRYRDENKLWQDAQSYYDILGIKEKVERAIHSSFDPNRLPEEILRLQSLLDTAQNAANKNTIEANRINLPRLLAPLQELVNLLVGLRLQEEGKLAEAVKLWRTGIPANSMFYDYALGRMNEVGAELENNEQLNKALEDAKAQREAGDLQAVYRILLPHVNKTNATRYPELSAQVAEVKARLSEKLQRDILANIAADMDDPSELDSLAALLREINIAAYERLGPQIQAALNIQEAHRSWKAARAGRDVQVWRQTYTYWERVQDERFKNIMTDVGENYIIIYAEVTLEKVRTANPSTVPHLRSELNKLLAEFERVVQHLPETPYLRVLRIEIMMRLLEMDDQPLYAEGALRGVLHELSQVDEQGEYAFERQLLSERHQLMEKTVRLAKGILKQLTVAAPFSEWQKAYHEFYTFFTPNLQAQLVGLVMWWNQFVAETEAALIEQKNKVDEVWQQVEPNAKITLITQRTPDFDLSYADNALQLIAQQVALDTVGQQLSQKHDERGYMEQLIRAAVALRFLAVEMEREHYGQADYFAIQDHADRILEALKSKEGTFKSVMDIVARVKESLYNARPTGRFAEVYRQLDIILKPEGAYYLYHEHPAVTHLVDEFRHIEREYNRLRGIAEQINEAAIQEDFARIHRLSVELMAEKARPYMAAHMVQYVDPFAEGELIEDVEDLLEVVKSKEEQIASLSSWLQPVVDLSALQGRLQQGANPYNLHPSAQLSHTTIADFYSLEQSLIEPLRGRARYNEALDELDRLEFGAVPPDQAASYFSAGVLSLEQALNYLKVAPFRDDVGLKSYTALSLYRWGVDLWRLLRQVLAYCNDLRDALERSPDLFAEERQLFYEIHDQLKQRRNYNENLCKLKRTYTCIRGDGSGKLTGTREQNVYPLAHLWDELDKDYQEFRRDIEKVC